MKNINEIPEDQLVAKYLAGEASPAEAMLVQDRFVESDNREELYSLLKIWNHTGQGVPFELPPVESTWKELKDKLKSKRTKTIPLKSLLVAASVVALAGLLFFFVVSADRSDQASGAVITFAIKSKGRILKQKLPDGTSVVLHRNASIQYTSTFNQTAREIELSGECFFDVAHDKTKPFLVTINDLHVRVVGTSFNVKQTGNQEVIVQVVSGIVDVYTDKKKMTVTKGQVCKYKVAEQHLVLDSLADVNNTSYATRNFRFNDLPVPNVVHLLEDAFAVKIQIASDELLKCRLSAEFEDKSLDYILNIITITLNGSYTQNRTNIKIYGKGCQ
jgi:ferric-dicitrate binding protein FerR (iron transport regulator)